MPSLIDNVGSGTSSSVQSGAIGRGLSGNSIVPRFFRVFVRRSSRFIATANPMRRGVGSVLALMFLLSGWVYGAVVGGMGPAMMGGVASIVGLQANGIVISGQVETREADVAEALGLGQSGTLVGFDLSAARDRVVKLPWVRDAALRKVYPGKLLVVVSEHRPAAVWQYGDLLAVVRKSGDVITKFGISELLNNRFAHLPHLIGEGAADAASDILPIADRHPEIIGRIASYQRVADRRWDIVLKNGVKVQLPELDHAAALARIAGLQKSQRVLDRELEVVDARLKDRLVFRLTADSNEARKEFVAARGKAIKKLNQGKERHL